MNSVTHFVLQTVERTVAAAAATGVTILGGTFINALTIDYRTLLGDMGGTAIVTLLICLASQNIGDLSAASIVTPIPPVTKEAAVKAPEAPVSPQPEPAKPEPPAPAPAPAPVAGPSAAPGFPVQPDVNQQSM